MSIIISLNGSPVATGDGYYAYTYNVQLTAGQLDPVSSGNPVQFGTIYDFGPLITTSGSQSAPPSSTVFIAKTGLLADSQNQFSFSFPNQSTPAATSTSTTTVADNPTLTNIRLTYIGSQGVDVAGQSTTLGNSAITVQDNSSDLGTFTVYSKYDTTTPSTFDSQDFKETNNTQQADQGSVSVPKTTLTYSISVSPGQGPEGTPSGGGTAFTYTVSRTGNLSATGTVDLSFSGTATPPGSTGTSDYTIASGTGTYASTGTGTGTLTFAANQTEATFVVTSTPDSTVEPDETVIATLADVASGGGAIGTMNSATATIQNDDAPAAPAAPALAASSDSGVSDSDDVTNVQTPIFTGAATAGAIVTIYDGGKIIGAETADPTTGAYSVSTSGLSQGQNSITATQTVNGLMSAMSAPTSVTLDTTAPALANETVTGNQLVLGYTETGSGLAGATPAASDYTVHVGTGTGTDNVTNVSVNAAAHTVTLTLAQAVNSGQAVTVSYAQDKDATKDLQDVAGNTAATFTDQSVNNTTAPSVASVVATPPSGTALDVGGIVTITVNTTSPVTVTGTPVLVLDVVGGATRAATYVPGGTGPSSSLSFLYQVQPGDNDADLKVLGVVLSNGASIGNANGTLSSNITADTGIQIDTTAPTVGATPTVAAAVNSGPTSIGIAAPTDNQPSTDSLTVTATGLPSDGTVLNGAKTVSVGNKLTVAQLTALTFTPTADAAGKTSSFTYSVTDQAGNAIAGTAELDIAAAGTPTIAGTAPLSDSAEGPVTPFGKVTLADPNKSANDTLTIALTGAGKLADGASVKNGTLTLAKNGSYTLTGTAGAIQTELQALTFTPTNAIAGGTAVTTLALTLTSGAGTSSATDKATVVTDVAAPPVDTGGGGSPPVPVLPVPVAPAPVTPSPVSAPVAPAPQSTSAPATPVAGSENAPTSTPAPDPYVPVTVTGGDGTITTTQLAPDGTSTTSVLSPDGTLSTTMVNPDGSSTETVSGGPAFDNKPFSSYTETFAPDGTLLTEMRDRKDGTTATIAHAPGQTLQSDGVTIFRGAGQANTTFVFNPGDALGVVHGFQVGGTGHDTLSLSGADFGNSLADVLRNTIDTAGGAVIFDPVTNDVVRLAGVTTAKLQANPGDFAFHA